MRKYLISLSGFVILHFASSVAFACSCEPLRRSETNEERFEAAYNAARTVFSGKVLEIKRIKASVSEDESQVIFKVLENWKGAATKRIVVTDSGCQYGFKTGNCYLVYAYNSEDGKLETGQCTRTKKLSEADLDLKVLNKNDLPGKLKT